MSTETYQNPYVNSPKRCTVLEWIAVGDVLPEEGVWVLVVENGKIWAAFSNHGLFWNAIGLRIELNATHWCPWPQPPKL